MVMSTDAQVSEQMRKLAPFLSDIAESNKIFVPPIPRYVFAGCCRDSTHAPNIHTEAHCKLMIAEHTRIRSTMKKSLVTPSTEHLRILDFINCITPANHNQDDTLTALRTFTATDNVHLNAGGYRRMADVIIGEAITLIHQRNEPKTQEVTIVSPIPDGAPLGNWRGFIGASGVGKRDVGPVLSRRGGHNHRGPYQPRRPRKF